MKRAALSLITGGVLIAGFGGQAAATPPYAGCPPPDSGFSVWYTSTQPYQGDNYVDMKGNYDGVVCAKPVDSKTFEYNGQTYPIENFIDNTMATQ
jgi:hypothetical protein